jgi:hypothetical protein
MQAARKSNTTRKVVTAKVKAPTKADLLRRGKIAMLGNATRVANKVTDADALYRKACETQGNATTAKLAVGLHLNREFQDECREMGIPHWSMATPANCNGDNGKALLQRIQFALSEIARINHELVLKGKGDSNVNRLIGDIKRLAYEAIFGSKPRTTVAKDVSDDTKAAMVKRYKAYMAIDADVITETQLNECRYIGEGLVALFKVDLATINTKN